MKELFLDKSITFITNQKDYSKEDIDKLRYGLEGIYLTFYKMIIILLVAFLLHILKEVLIFLIIFNIIRYPAFGFHANTSLECLIISLICVVGIPFLLLRIDLNLYTKILIDLICVIQFILYAPADTVKRPLPNKKKRKIRKICAIICCILYSIISIIFNNYISDLLIAAIIVETIMINPLIYKIFKQPYRNYLNMV